jgi:phosphonate dehydrogenase
MPRIVLTHWAFPETLALLQPHGDVIANNSPATLPPEELLRRAADAEALMAFMPDRIGADFLDACPKLKIVAGALKGFDNLDLFACAARGVWVSNVPSALTIPTAELAIGLLLALTRNIVPGDAAVRRPGYTGWQPSLYGSGVNGKNIGILGFGEVGQTIAQRLLGFDANVVYCDPTALNSAREPALRVQRVDVDALLATSDIVILAAPLTPNTLHLLNRENLARMKPGAYLVNIGRGSVADENAVADALRENRLAGYAADVFEMEDLSRADRPREIPRALLNFPDRTVFTPHLGSAVVDVRKDIERQAALNIIDVLQGRRPRNAVNNVGGRIA